MPCEAVPPFELPSSPGPEDEELEAFVGMRFLGTCDCEAEPYVPPECGCETCDDVTGHKSFTVAGITGADSAFNGDYVLMKDEPDCRWIGDNGNPSCQATLEFIGGTWVLTFVDSSTTTYVLTAEVCADELIMPKDSGAVEFPTSVTVTGTV